MKGTNTEVIAQIRQDIQNFKQKVDKVVILWTANTEMFLTPEIDSIEELDTKI